MIDGKTNKLMTNIPIKDQHRTFFDTSILTPWAAIVATLGAIVTAIVGLRTYNQGQILKKKDIQKDIVFPLISEFDKPEGELQRAKLILDDVPLEFDPNEPSVFYTKEKLLVSLQDHNKPIRGFDKVKDALVRGSFDRLLDFFSKLSYLKDIGLLEDREIDYFPYYIDKAANNEAVINYIKTYHSSLNLISLDRNPRVSTVKQMLLKNMAGTKGADALIIIGILGLVVAMIVGIMWWRAIL